MSARDDKFLWSDDDIELVALVDEEDDLDLGFCPTGPGGGVDNSCGRESDLKGSIKDLTFKLGTLYKIAEEIKIKAAKERALSPNGTATSATKAARSKINKQIDSLKQDLVGLHKQLEPQEEIPKLGLGPDHPTPSSVPESPPGVTFAGQHTDAPVFAGKYQAETWLQKEYKLTLQVEGKVSDDRVTALAQVSGQHLAHMSNNFELLDKYRTEPGKMGDPGGYGTYTQPYRESGNYRITTALKGSVGGDYNPNSGTIRMKESLKIYTTAPHLGAHNVDFSYAGCFRHEYGHRVWGLAIENKDRKEFREIYQKYNGGVSKWAKSDSAKSLTLGAKTVSTYAMTNEREFFAEAFCAVTSPAYGDNGKKLPEDLESYMHKLLGKRETALDYAFGVQLAFCPTGPGGGVDNSCGREGAIASLDVQALKNKLAYHKTTRDEAVAKIKEIKAAGSTKGLSQWKKIRKEQNQKMKEVQDQLHAAQLGKPYVAPPNLTPAKETLTSSPGPGLLPYYVPGESHPVYAKSLGSVQELYPKATTWNPAKAPLPIGHPIGPTLSEPKKEPGLAWVTDGGVPQGGVKNLGDNEAKNQYKSWANNLTSEEKAGISLYTGSYYNALNSGFRKGIFESHQLNTIHGIDSALAKAMPIKEPTLLYRKVGSEAKDLGKLKAGDVYVERGYVSTSISKGVWSGTYKMNILCPPGAKGAYIQSISGHKAEKEFLMPRDTMFKVHRVRDEEGTGGKVIDLEVVVAKPH